MRIPLTISDEVAGGLTCVVILTLHVRYRTSHKRVMFLIDTGCGTTILTNRHAREFNLPMNVEDSSVAFQLGGHTMKKKSLGTADLLFQTTDGVGIRLQAQPLFLALTTSKDSSKIQDAQEIPALIGRDFLKYNKLALHYNPSKNEAYLETE